MKEQGYFVVERIIDSKYVQRWRFLTQWDGYTVGEATWEPWRAFAIGGGEVNPIFETYCLRHDLHDALNSCKKLSARWKRK